MTATGTQPRLRGALEVERPSVRLLRRLALAALLVLALALRLREPLSSPILAAEDPYLHMVKAYDLVQGRGLPQDYPPGFAVLLAPFALLGAPAFTFVARFLPPFFGLVEVLGVYLLCREHLRTPAAFVAATLVALMPENVFRTNILFPTGLDLAALPFYLLLLLRAGEGSRGALVGAAGLALALAFIHPWVLVYMAPPAVLVALFALRRRNARAKWVALGVVGALAAGFALAMALPSAWNPAPEFFKHAGPRFLEIVREPSLLAQPPIHVDLPAMLTWPVLALAGVGAVTALVRPTRLGLVALVYSAAILPFVLVDWFDIWFIPHRSVAYLSLGFALLAALPIELMGALPEPADAERPGEGTPRRARLWDLARSPSPSPSPTYADVAAAGIVIAMALTLILPVAASVQPWYRLYDGDDQRAWRALDARDPPLVVAGSWQGAVGYRAMTGNDAVFNPQFFRDAQTRAHDTGREPGLVVLVDAHARASDVETGWLREWRKVGEWGDVAAYRR